MKKIGGGCDDETLCPPSRNDHFQRVSMLVLSDVRDEQRKPANVADGSGTKMYRAGRVKGTAWKEKFRAIYVRSINTRGMHR